MTVHVHFVETRNIGPVNHGNLTAEAAPGVASVRQRDAIALAAVSTHAALAGEIIIVSNEETTSILVAYGSSPDAAATTSTNATTAGILVQAGQNAPIYVATAGDKVSAKVVS